MFSTVHKAKGLEFDTVRVTDDFLLDDQSATENNEGGKTYQQRLSFLFCLLFYFVLMNSQMNKIA